MELKVEIGFDELLIAIKQLPESQLTILKHELYEKEGPAANISALRNLLLKGPIMGDNQYEEFKATRKLMNQWRTK